MSKNRPNNKSLSHQKEATSHSVSRKSTKAKEYGVYLLIPEGSIKKKALDMALEHGCTITPHITIIQNAYLETSLERIYTMIQNWSVKQKAFEIQFKNKIEFGTDNNTFWNVDTCDVLHHINKEISSLLDPLRDGNLQCVTENLDILTTTQKKLVSQYGRYHNVPESNDPHITVAYDVQNSHIKNRINKDFGIHALCQKVSDISIGEIDVNGNILETLQTFKLDAK